MAFSDFKNVQQVIEQYPLQLHRERFLSDVRLELPDWFIENLNFLLDQQAEIESEVFFRESFIFPFLQQVWKQHPKLKVWINGPLRYDAKLCGEPDYFISRKTEEVTDRLVNLPMLAVVEAKRQDFDEGWGQCLAAMLACQKIDADESLTIYGIVTTGLVWEFGKLTNQRFTRDPRVFGIADPPQIFGLLDVIFGACEKQLG